DIYDEETWKKVEEVTNTKQVDVIITDMAHPFTQSKEANAARVFDLCFKAIDLVDLKLKTGGNFCCKFFQGVEQEQLHLKLKDRFEKVSYFKPLSSRKESAEASPTKILVNNENSFDQLGLYSYVGCYEIKEDEVREQFSRVNPFLGLYAVEDCAKLCLLSGYEFSALAAAGGTEAKRAQVDHTFQSCQCFSEVRNQQEVSRDYCNFSCLLTSKALAEANVEPIFVSSEATWNNIVQKSINGCGGYTVSNNKENTTDTSSTDDVALGKIFDDKNSTLNTPAITLFASFFTLSAKQSIFAVNNVLPTGIVQVQFQKPSSIVGGEDPSTTVMTTVPSSSSSSFSLRTISLPSVSSTNINTLSFPPNPTLVSSTESQPFIWDDPSENVFTTVGSNVFSLTTTTVAIEWPQPTSDDGPVTSQVPTSKSETNNDNFPFYISIVLGFLAFGLFVGWQRRQKKRVPKTPTKMQTLPELQMLPSASVLDSNTVSSPSSLTFNIPTPPNTVNSSSASVVKPIDREFLESKSLDYPQPPPNTPLNLIKNQLKLKSSFSSFPSITPPQPTLNSIKGSLISTRPPSTTEIPITEKNSVGENDYFSSELRLNSQESSIYQRSILEFENSLPYSYPKTPPNSFELSTATAANPIDIKELLKSLALLKSEFDELESITNSFSSLSRISGSNKMDNEEKRFSLDKNELSEKLYSFVNENPFDSEVLKSALQELKNQKSSSTIDILEEKEKITKVQYKNNNDAMVNAFDLASRLETLANESDFSVELDSKLSVHSQLKFSDSSEKNYVESSDSIADDDYLEYCFSDSDSIESPN
ncbi:rRNA methyltransferase 2, mitochondrial, partial [Clydaea vesicula]